MRSLPYLILGLMLWSGQAFAANPQSRDEDQRRRPYVIELYPDKAPKTVDNFLQYVKDGSLQRHASSIASSTAS